MSSPSPFRRTPLPILPRASSRLVCLGGMTCSAATRPHFDILCQEPASRYPSLPRPPSAQVSALPLRQRPCVPKLPNACHVFAPGHPFSTGDVLPPDLLSQLTLFPSPQQAMFSLNPPAGARPVLPLALTTAPPLGSLLVPWPHPTSPSFLLSSLFDQALAHRTFHQACTLSSSSFPHRPCFHSFATGSPDAPLPIATALPLCSEIVQISPLPSFPPGPDPFTTPHVGFRALLWLSLPSPGPLCCPRDPRFSTKSPEAPIALPLLSPSMPSRRPHHLLRLDP